ncbi:hypothetical protein GN244_ATG14163 [Phytophthora infestans]|uniref:Uncharacterized protein n=1 Tax=Phytophthora infestans TaxID=4787 RepID=A0A833SKE9_PHYIN|nr:hypothetical protein GN244_ATG14163 [Phytophthora infestans]KAF4128198.1 hypothetical protein GN958_ATG22610 [Phytophthora infestans]
MENRQLTQLREKLRRLEQENDDLQSRVRRLEATERDLTHRLERADEELILAREIESVKGNENQSEQIRDLTVKLEGYESVMDRLLTAVGIPVVRKKEAHEVKPLSGEEENTGRDDEGNNTAPFELGATTCSPATEATETGKLRAELKVKAEELQSIKDSYDEFFVVSCDLERALSGENEDLKFLVDKLRMENASLRDA